MVFGCPSPHFNAEAASRVTGPDKTPVIFYGKLYMAMAIAESPKWSLKLKFCTCSWVTIRNFGGVGFFGQTGANGVHMLESLSDFCLKGQLKNFGCGMILRYYSITW